MKPLYILIIFFLLRSGNSEAQVTANCRDSIFAYFNGYGFSVINPSYIDSASFSPVGIKSFSLDTSSFPLPPGDHIVTLTITDNLNNSATCQSLVKTRFLLDPPPLSVCKNIDVYLDRNGNAAISPGDVDSASISAVGILNMTLSKYEFDCNEIGIVVDTLTITDLNMAQSFCIASVNVKDTVKPTAKCKDYIEVPLNSNGTVTVDPMLLNAGSIDNCDNDLSFQLDVSTFDCTKIGINHVQLTVTDDSGNERSCPSIIRILDETPPNAICNNVTKTLNSSGWTSVTLAELNGGTNDACGLANVILENNLPFTCNNVGVNYVTLMATDQHGNFSTCQSKVTIENVLGPNAMCKDISIVLDKDGDAYISHEDVDNGSNDVCKITLSIDKFHFTRSDVGVNNVILTVTNSYGATSTCTSHVTVSDPAACITGTVYNTSNSPVLTTNDFRFVEVDENDNIWAGTSGSGLFMYNGTNWVVPYNQFGMSGFIVRAMRKDPLTGDIWVGMSKTSPCLGYVGGIYAYPSQSYYNRYLPPIVSPTINEQSTFFDLYAYALLTFGIELPTGSNYWSFLDIYNTQLQSLVVRCLDFNKLTKKNWAGCTPQICQPGFNGGLSRIDNGVYNVVRNGMPPYSNLDRFITAITSGANGDVYAAVAKSCMNTCNNPYIARYDSNGVFLGKIEYTNTAIPINLSSSSNAVRAIFKDSQNRLWIGGEQDGISVIESNGSISFLDYHTIPEFDFLFTVNFDAINEGPDGSIYFGTSKGLLRFNGSVPGDPNKWKKICINGTTNYNVGSIHFDSKRNMWISTRSGIICIPDPGAIVEDVFLNTYSGILQKKPLQGATVTATGSNSVVTVITGSDGAFQRVLDAQLLAGTYTLEVNYQSPQSNEIYRAVLNNYHKGDLLNNIQFPVKLIKQSRELISRMKNPSPAAYEITIMDIPYKTQINKGYYKFNDIETSLNSWTNQPVNFNDLPAKVDRLARGYLSLYAHEILLNIDYEVKQIWPKAIIGSITTAIDIAIFAIKLAEPPSGEPETRDKIIKAAKISAFKVAAERAIYNLKQFSAKQSDPVDQAMIGAVIDALKVMLNRIDVGTGNDPTALYGAAKDLISDALVNGIFISSYEVYLKRTQKYIDDLNFNLNSAITDGNISTGVERINELLADIRERNNFTQNLATTLFTSIDQTDFWRKAIENLPSFLNLKPGLVGAGLKKAFVWINAALFASIEVAYISAAVSGWRTDSKTEAAQKLVNGRSFNPLISPIAPVLPVSVSGPNPGFNPQSSTGLLSSEMSDYHALLNQIIQKLQNNDIEMADEIDSLISLDSVISNSIAANTKRIDAVAKVAGESLADFDSLQSIMISDILRFNTGKLAFDLGILTWLNDTSQHDFRDTLIQTIDTLKMICGRVSNSIDNVKSLVSTVSVPRSVLINELIYSRDIPKGSTGNVTLKFGNYGSLQADSVQVILTPAGGFTFSPDSVNTGSLAAGDSGHLVFNFTAPVVDTFAVIPVRLIAGNDSMYFESFELRTYTVCADTFFLDSDGDGFGTADSFIVSCDSLKGYVSDRTDCIDQNDNAYPGAFEICDGIDNNCNGLTDEGVKLTLFEDADGDGYGNSFITIQACTVSQGYSLNGNDCNDTMANIHPNAKEICNGIDENCNGQNDDGAYEAFFRDIDGDGTGNPADTIMACFMQVGYIDNANDCDDSRADVKPGNIELCNTLDDNCNGHIDEGCGGNTYYKDDDNDGFGNPNRSINTPSATPPSGYLVDNTDCDDTRASDHPGVPEVCNGRDDNCNGSVDEGVLLTFYRDADQDGFGSLANSVQACIAPTGYIADNTDCNDNNSLINPNAAEIVCNGIDENCNIVTDEGIQPVFYADADNDGYGNPAVTVNACTVPAGYTTDSTDCNDASASIHPNTSEICNTLDDNCNVIIDEGVQSTFYQDADNDSYGSSTATVEACSQPPGFVSNSDDCNDGSNAIHPGLTELCNGIDDNCNNTTDEGVSVTFYEDADGDGYGGSTTALACTAPSGFVNNSSDCNDGNGNIHPGGTEVCNNLDDDCDGIIDENVTTVFYRDFDSDGFGDLNSTTNACLVPAGFVANSADCNDTNSFINPNGTEACDLIDDNCNGIIDEGVQTTYYRDADSDGYGNLSITRDACSLPLGYSTDSTDCDDGNSVSHPGTSEMCNGIDDNCNGAIDEFVENLFYRDVDGDGYGNPGITYLSCIAPTGYVADSTDCNDNDFTVNPGASEICNSIDDDCNGLIDDGCPYVTLNLKVFIEGFYSGNGTMISAIDPFGNSTQCDTLTVELRNANSPYEMIHSNTKVIDVNGNGTFLFPITTIGQSFYLSVHHRNALETWSAMPILISNVNIYDFTSSITKAFGNNMVATYDNSGWAIFSGDISDASLGLGIQDGVIESSDYTDMENAVSTILTGYVAEDLSGDRVVESSDYILIENNVSSIIFTVRP